MGMIYVLLDEYRRMVEEHPEKLPQIIEELEKIQSEIKNVLFMANYINNSR